MPLGLKRWRVGMSTCTTCSHRVYCTVLCDPLGLKRWRVGVSTCTTHSHRVYCTMYTVAPRSETLTGGRVHLHHPLSQSVLYCTLCADRWACPPAPPTLRVYCTMYTVAPRSETLTGGHVHLHHPFSQSVLYCTLWPLGLKRWQVGVSTCTTRSHRV